VGAGLGGLWVQTQSPGRGHGGRRPPEAEEAKREISVKNF